jgi:hypothetical protein
MMSNIPLRPAHPERICWGCDKYCAADDLACGNGTIRTPHPCELFGEDWLDWCERPHSPRSDLSESALAAAGSSSSSVCISS